MDPSKSDPVFILTSGQLKVIISEAVEKAISNGDISKIQAEVVSLREQLDLIQRFVEVCHGKIPDLEWFPELSKAYEHRREVIDDSVTQVQALNDFLENDIIPVIKAHDKTFRNLQTGQASSSVGKTTLKRIADVKKLLMENGGSISFKTLRTKMKLEPNQLTRLIESLDRRSFEVVQNPRAKKEKILRLKVRFS